MSLGQGKDPRRAWGTVRTVTSASAAAPVRLVAIAFALVTVLAFVVAGRADGAQRSWSTYLAPESACRSASDPLAAPAVQASAVSCLVNWARTHDRRARSRTAHGSPTRRRAEGRARGVVRAVLAYTVRVGGDRGGSGCGLPLRDLRRESLRGHAGTRLGARRRQRVAPVSAASGQPPQPELPRRGRCAGPGARAARRRRRGRLDRDVRLPPLARQDSRRPAVE